MTLENLLRGSAVVAALTIVQLAPIKINPWSWIGKLFKKLLNAFGRAMNSDILVKLDEVNHTQQESQKKLDVVESRLNEHIKTDDRRDADAHRLEILRFNNELLRGKRHTKEMFIEVLAEIDAYESYCKNDKDYPNNRAVLAIENIQSNYKERLQKHDFLQEGTKEE